MGWWSNLTSIFFRVVGIPPIRYQWDSMSFFFGLEWIKKNKKKIQDAEIGCGALDMVYEWKIWRYIKCLATLFYRWCFWPVLRGSQDVKPGAISQSVVRFTLVKREQTTPEALAKIARPLAARSSAALQWDWNVSLTPHCQFVLRLHNWGHHSAPIIKKPMAEDASKFHRRFSVSAEWRTCCGRDMS